MLEGLHSLDQGITLAINSVHSTLSDQLWVFMSDKKVWAPFYLLTVALLVWRIGWKKTMIVAASIIISILACDQLGNVVKDSVCRLRPCYNTYMLDNGLHILEGRGHLFGFYSAHAADAFGFVICALFCLYGLDKVNRHHAYAALGLFWATMVSISRVFVGKHFFGDIMVGAIVGCLIGYALSRAAIAICNRVA